MPEQTATAIAPQTTVEVPQTTQTQTTQTTPETGTQTAVVIEPSTDDIVSKITAKPAPKIIDGGTFKEFDDIVDPVQKQKLIDKAKALQADYTKKTQEVATERKAIKEQLDDMQTWDEVKVQKYLLSNPTFLTAAQKIAAGPQQDNTFGLNDFSDEQKKQLMELNRQVGELRQQNFTAAMTQKDALLQSKYGDYDTLKVNEGIQNLGRINPIDIREHVYKSIFHDEHVKAAYEMGRKDGQGLNQTRTQAITSSNGSNITPSQGKIVKEKGENDQALLTRIFMNNIAKSKEQIALRR